MLNILKPPSETKVHSRDLSSAVHAQTRILYETKLIIIGLF